MRRGLLLCIFVLILNLGLSSLPVGASVQQTATIQPGSWAAVDGLGRTLSSSAQVGTPKEDKYVGIFYWNWHTYFSYAEPRNITQIINAHPEA